LTIFLQIDVYLKGGNLCEGTVVVTYDPHYYCLDFQIRYPTTMCSFETLSLKLDDDSLDLNNPPIRHKHIVWSILRQIARLLPR